MYNVSQRYLNNIGKNGRTLSWFGTITLEDGETVYHFDYSDIMPDNFSIKRQVCESDKLTVGQTCSSELQMTLLLTEIDGQFYLDGQTVDRYAFYNATVDVTFRLWFNDEEYEDVPVGIFIVSEPLRTNRKLQLTCYDYMILFSVDKGDAIGAGTPYDLISYACEACGVELGSTEEEIEALPNGDMITEAHISVKIQTWRDFLGLLSASLCAAPYIGRDGKLYFAQFGNTVCRTVYENCIYEFELADYETYYTSVSAFIIDSQQIAESTIQPDDGLRLKYSNNPFVQNNTVDRLDNVLDSISAFRYVPCSARLTCDPSFDCMDVLYFENRGTVSTRKSCVTQLNISLSGMEVVCSGENPKTIDVQSKLSSEVENLSLYSSGSKMTYYDYVNASDITIHDGENAKNIIDIRYAVSSDTHMDFHAEIKHTISEDSVVTVSYLVNGAMFDYHPSQMELEGVNLLHLLLPFTSPSGTNTRLVVMLEIDGGDLEIEAGDIRAYLAGYGGLVTEREWDGYLEFEESVVQNAPIPQMLFNEDSATDAVVFSQQTPTASAVTDSYTAVAIPVMEFDDSDLTDAVAFSFVVYTATIDASSQVVRSATYTNIANDQFVLQTEYTETSEAVQIDDGYCTKVTPFVTDLTVSNVVVMW